MTAEGQLLRSDVWLVDFGADPQDPEQAFLRLVVIVSDDRLHYPNLRMVIVVPGTSTTRQIPLHMVVAPDHDNGLATETALQVEQVRAVSRQRPTVPAASRTCSASSSMSIAWASSNTGSSTRVDRPNCADRAGVLVTGRQVTVSSSFCNYKSRLHLG